MSPHHCVLVPPSYMRGSALVFEYLSCKMSFGSLGLGGLSCSSLALFFASVLNEGRTDLDLNPDAPAIASSLSRFPLISLYSAFFFLFNALLAEARVIATSRFATCEYGWGALS